MASIRARGPKWRDRCRRAVVAQIIQKNAPRPPLLSHTNDETIGIFFSHRDANRACDRFGDWPTDSLQGFGVERHNDVQSFTTGGFDERA